MFACENLIEDELRKGFSNILALKKVKEFYLREIEDLQELIKENQKKYLDPDDETDIYELQDRDVEFQKKLEFNKFQVRKVLRKLKLEREMNKLA